MEQPGVMRNFQRALSLVFPVNYIQEMMAPLLRFVVDFATAFLLGVTFIISTFSAIVSLDNVLISLYNIVVSYFSKMGHALMQYSIIFIRRSERERKKISLVITKLVSYTAWACIIYGIPYWACFKQNVKTVSFSFFMHIVLEVFCVGVEYETGFPSKGLVLLLWTNTAMSVVLPLALNKHSAISVLYLTLIMKPTIDSLFAAGDLIIGKEAQNSNRDAQKEQIALEVLQSLFWTLMSLCLMAERPRKDYVLYGIVLFHETIELGKNINRYSAKIMHDRIIAKAFKKLTKEELKDLRDETCAVCLCEHTTESVRLPCHHMLHTSCLNRILLQRTNSNLVGNQQTVSRCPMCRAEILLTGNNNAAASAAVAANGTTPTTPPTGSRQQGQSAAGTSGGSTSNAFQPIIINDVIRLQVVSNPDGNIALSTSAATASGANSNVGATGTMRRNGSSVFRFEPAESPPAAAGAAEGVPVVQALPVAAETTPTRRTYRFNNTFHLPEGGNDNNTSNNMPHTTRNRHGTSADNLPIYGDLPSIASQSNLQALNTIVDTINFALPYHPLDRSEVQQEIQATIAAANTGASSSTGPTLAVPANTGASNGNGPASSFVVNASEFLEIHGGQLQQLLFQLLESNFQQELQSFVNNMGNGGELEVHMGFEMVTGSNNNGAVTTTGGGAPQQPNAAAASNVAATVISRQEQTAAGFATTQEVGPSGTTDEAPTAAVHRQDSAVLDSPTAAVGAAHEEAGTSDGDGTPPTHRRKRKFIPATSTPLEKKEESERKVRKK